MMTELSRSQRADAQALVESLDSFLGNDLDMEGDVRSLIAVLEEHARLLRRVIAAETRFIEGPRPLSVPRSWAEIEALVRPIGLTVWPMFSGYARAAAVILNMSHDPLIQTFAGVALRLRDDFDPSAFPPPFEEDFAKAFAVVLGGVIIHPSYTDEERELVESPFGEEQHGV